MESLLSTALLGYKVEQSNAYQASMDPRPIKKKFSAKDSQDQAKKVRASSSVNSIGGPRESNSQSQVQQIAAPPPPPPPPPAPPEPQQEEVGEDAEARAQLDEQMLRDLRKDKSEKEKDRRHHLNVLFNELGNLLGVAGQNKTQILANAREFLRQHSPISVRNSFKKS